jgi:hypothetical protein
MGLPAIHVQVIVTLPLSPALLPAAIALWPPVLQIADIEPQPADLNQWSRHPNTTTVFIVPHPSDIGSTCVRAGSMSVAR